MNIARLRRRMSLTQEDLAEMTGLSQTLISRAEAGDDGTTMRSLRAISAALNAPLSDLFADRSEAEEAALQLFRNLPADRQSVWLGMAQAFQQDRASPKG